MIPGAIVLDEVLATITKYVKFAKPEDADAVTLYTASTWAIERLQVAPRLVIRSPERRCGKSRLVGDILGGGLLRNSIAAVSMSPAALVHSITEADPPTIVLDEVDTIFHSRSGDDKTELLRGILNAGFNRGAPYIRWDPTSRTLDRCPTFAPAVLAGIDNSHLPDTILDRSVVITLRRKTPDEEVARFRARKDGPAIVAVGDRLAGWVTARAAEIGAAEPELPDELNDRAQDLWEGLLAVADLAGADWPERARTAALELSGDKEEGGGEGRRLLADLREVFGSHPRMQTSEIITGLRQIEEAPWSSMYGRGIDARLLARLLAPYDVHPRTIKVSYGVTAKGYQADDLHDAWSRYLPHSGAGAVTSVTSGTSQLSMVTGEDGETSPPSPGYAGDGNAKNLRNHPDLGEDLKVPGVTEVTDTVPGRCKVNYKCSGDTRSYDGEWYCERHARMMIRSLTGHRIDGVHPEALAVLAARHAEAQAVAIERREAAVRGQLQEPRDSLRGQFQHLHFLITVQLDDIEGPQKNRPGSPASRAGEAYAHVGLLIFTRGQMHEEGGEWGVVKEPDQDWLTGDLKADVIHRSLNVTGTGPRR